jgi:hypothetical protein
MTFESRDFIKSLVDTDRIRKIEPKSGLMFFVPNKKHSVQISMDSSVIRSIAQHLLSSSSEWSNLSLPSALEDQAMSMGAAVCDQILAGAFQVGPDGLTFWTPPITSQLPPDAAISPYYGPYCLLSLAQYLDGKNHKA